MRRHFRSIAFLVLASLISSCAPSQPPKTVTETMIQVLGYRAKDPITVIERKFEYPFSIQGINYLENVTVQLSSDDLRQLIDALSANPRFKRRTVGLMVIYDDIENPKRRISCSISPDRNQLKYYYREQ